MARALALICAPPSKMLALRQGFHVPRQVAVLYWKSPR
jgi:hypothetical protein